MASYKMLKIQYFIKMEGKYFSGNDFSYISIDINAKLKMKDIKIFKAIQSF